MSRSIDGYLMLGWEVETEDVANYDEMDGLSEDAEAKVTEILGKRWIERSWCEPIVFPSLYYDCDYMYVGVVLMNSKYSLFEPKPYGEFLSANAETLTDTAKELYRAIMGKEPDEEPVLMCVASEG